MSAHSDDSDVPTGVPAASRLAYADARMRVLQQQHAVPLYRFLLRLTFGEQHLAEDLLQETMLRAWRNLNNLPDDGEPVRRWLFTVARRVAIDAARARRARPTEVGMNESTLPSVEGDEESVVAAQTVRRALPMLSPRHRTVLIEVYFFGRSVEDIAHRLGIPEGTVKSRAHYALRALRAAIGRIDGE